MIPVVEQETEAKAVRLWGMELEKGRWVLIVLGFIINVCLGSVYAYSVFKNPVQTRFNVGAFEGGLPFMFFLASFAVLMFFGGRVLGRLGPKKVGITGGVLVGGGWVLSGLLPAAVENIWMLVLTYGIVAGAGVGLAYGCPIAVATRWFPDRKGLAVGLTLAGFGGSAFITANIARPLISSFGPLTTFLMMGLTFLVVVIALSALLKFPEAGWKPSGWKPVIGTASSGLEITSKEMMKTPTFWGLFISFTIACLAGLMAIGIASPVGTEVIALSSATAAVLVGVFAIFNGGGRPLFGWLTDIITPRWSAVLALALILIASLLMLMAGAGDTALYTICFIVLWLCLGGWLAIAPTATTNYFGPRNYTTNYGVVFFSYGIGAILANIISGQSKDMFGSYDVAFIIVAALAGLGIALSFLYMKPPRAAKG